jgi:DNA adenine methylase
MAWPGGKDGAGVVQRLVNEIPPHDVFVSAFLGDCAVMRTIRPAVQSIGIDLDRENVGRWADANQVSGREFFCCDAVEWLRYRFGWYRVAGSGGGGSGGAADGSSVAGSSDAAAGDAKSSDGTRLRTLVYCDPPYLLQSRRNGRRMYVHEMTEEDHAKLLATLVWLPCLVMVSHYPCAMYDAALAGWRSFAYRAMTRAGKMATEKVWCNYPVPSELHDARFLGRNKRERERIRRRVRRATAKIAGLPPLERQAVLDAIITGRRM